MHVLTGESALRALRAVRYRELIVPVDYLTPIRWRAYLPGQELREVDDAYASARAGSFAEALSEGPTLEAMDFDFAAVESNARVDLWYLGDVGCFTEERPLELGVFDRGKRVWRKKSRVRLLARDLPGSALVRVNPTLYFVCPELVVLHMAGHRSLLQLAKLIMELCGNYALYPDPDVRKAAKLDLEPVTTLDRIRSFLGRVKTYGGRDRLKSALSIAMEGSASPGETNMALMMSLPPELGGYGFAQPQLNAMIVPPEEERACVGGDTYYPDAFWQGSYTDLEYESTDFHLDPLAAESLVAARQGSDYADPEIVAQRVSYIRKADADRRRLRDLQFLGIQVIPVTSFDFADVRRMDQVAQALARKHLRAEKWYEAFPNDRLAKHTRDATSGRRGRKRSVDAPYCQTRSAGYWESWPERLDERSYREARAALLQSLAEDES